MSRPYPSTGKSRRLSWPFLAVILAVLQPILLSAFPRNQVILACNSTVLLIVLAIAAWISAYNALTSKRSIHLFWVFVAAGSGLWSLNSLFGVLFNLVPEKQLFDPMLAGSVLFLHTIMLLAAMASGPHMEELDEGFYRATLNSLLILSSWIFVYAFLLISGGSRHWNGFTTQWFAVVYCAANVTLAGITLTVALRTQGTWRSIYLCLFGASLLYSVGSLFANLSLVKNRYSPGLFDSLNIVAASFLLRAAICGKGSATLAVGAVPKKHNVRSMGLPTMLASTTVLLLGVLEFMRANEPGPAHTTRLIAILVAGLLFAATAFTREYLVQRRFALDIDRVRDQLYLAMQSGKSIAWDLDVVTGEGTWFGDLDIFFGIPAATCILPAQRFYLSVHPDDRFKVSQAISGARENAKPFAVIFRMVLPNNASIWVSSHGRFCYKANGVPNRMLGVAVDIDDEKQSEVALDEKETKLRLVLKSTVEGIYGIDLNGCCTFCNPAAVKILGFSHAEDLVGRKIHDLIHHTEVNGKPYPASACPILAALQGREVHSDNEVFWKANGEPFPVEYWGYPQQKGSEIVGAVVAFVDVTERRQAQYALRETESRFRHMADRAPVLLWMSGKDTSCDYFNKTWLDFTGRSLEAEIGSGWLEGVYLEDRDSYTKMYNESYAERKPFSTEYRLKRHDGEYRWILANGVPRFSLSQDFEGYIGSAIDVTEVRRAEEVLEKNEEEFRLVFDAAHLGWWVWNGDTGHIVANDGTRVVLGLPLGAETTLQSFLNTVHPEDRERVYRTWLRALEDGAYYFVEYRTLWADGTLHWVESRGRTYSSSYGKPVQMVGVTMDITERKRAEDALRSVSGRLIAAQEEERARIARELHDDVCQRLVILGIELERMKGQPELAAGTLQEWAGRLAQFSGQIANDLQALSHELHSSKLEILGIPAAMKTFCAEFAKQHRIEVEFTSSSSSLPLSPDVSVCLYRILQEGLRNAAKHSRADRIVAELRGEHRAVELIIRDSGIGFDPEQVARGHGLGLISMQERINLVKGTLSIESQPKWGTTIRARVPVEEMNAAQCA